MTNGSGTVALTVTGSGSLTLTGQNSYSGTTTVDGGTVQVGSGGASGVLGGGNVVDNGTLIFNRSNDITVSNAISGTGSVVQQGTGSLYLTGDNNYGGATSRTIINNGLFVVTSSASLGVGNSGLLIAGSGVLDLNGFNVTVSALTLANGVIESTRGNPTLAASSYAVMSGTISVALVDLPGTASTLSKSTAYGVLLSGQNTYSGLTTINDGSLEIGANARPPVLTGGGANVLGGSLVFDYTTGDDPASVIQGLLATSYQNGFHRDPSHPLQIFDSSATSPMALGWADNGTNQVMITPAIYGDATLDGVVGPDDLCELLTNYGKSGMTWAEGDFTYDGIVGPADLSKLLTQYGVQAQSGPPSVVEVDRLGADPTNANSVQFAVAFSEGVTGVDLSDFHLVCSAGVSGTIDSLDSYGPTGQQAVFVVTVGNVFGTGTLGLNFADPGTTIHDSDGNALTGPGSGGTAFVGQTYTLVNAGAYQPPSGTGILPDWLNVVQQTDPNELLHALTGSVCPNGQGDGIQVTSCTLMGQVDTSGSTVVAASTAVFVNNLDPGENAYSYMAPYGIVLSTGDATKYGTGPNTVPDTDSQNDHGLTHYFGGHDKAKPASKGQNDLLNPISGEIDHYDVTQLDLTFNVLPGYDHITFQIVWGSEEYAHWIGSPFPDAFGVFVNGINVATTVDLQKINVNNSPGIIHQILQTFGYCVRRIPRKQGFSWEPEKPKGDNLWVKARSCCLSRRSIVR